MTKKLVWIGMFVGSTIGNMLPLVWGGDALSISGFLLSLLGGAGGFDAHIVETHHAAKKDAPSGTALTLRAAAEWPRARGAAARGANQPCSARKS